MKLPIRERLFKRRSIDPVTNCWEWNGARSNNGTGYGLIKYQNKLYRVHRLAFELFNGPIPPDMSVCHTCDNKLCFNPAHLFIGTHTDNMQDMVNKGRNSCGNKYKTQCVNGHDLLTENDYRLEKTTQYRNGKEYMRRVCKKCEVARSQNRRFNNSSQHSE